MNKHDINYYEKEADKSKYLFLDYITPGKIIATMAHIHDSIEIVLVTKLGCDIYINGEKLHLNEGDAAFIDCFDVHYYEYIEGSEYYVFLISRQYFNSINGFDKNVLNTYLPKCDKYREIKNLFDSAYVFWEDGNEAFRYGFVNTVLGIMSSQYRLKKREDKGDVKMLVDALIYINENFTENITLEFLSKKFAYSKNYFSALFNKFVNMNLREYINRCRIREFEHLKSFNTNTSVSAIARQCGFNDMKTFYRAYEKYSEKQM